MAIKMEQIKELREKTGAGVMEAKRSLEEAKGDMQKAEEIIKRKGQAKAESKSERETRQGIIFAYAHHNGRSGTIVKLLCETDFVALTDDFKNLAKELALQITSMKPKSVGELLTQEYIRDPKITIEQVIKAVSGKVGEKIKLEGFERLEI